MTVAGQIQAGGGARDRGRCRRGGSGWNDVRARDRLANNAA